MGNVMLIEQWGERPSSSIALQDFLTFKKATGLSDRTLLDYRKIVGAFFRDHREAWESPQRMRRAVTLWLSQDISSAYYNLRLVYLRSFWRWAIEEEIQPETPDPFRGFKRRKDNGRFHNINLEDVKALIEAIPQEGYASIRDRTAVILTLDIAIRPGEMLQLLPGDFDLTGLSVTIPAPVAKTRDSRTLPLSITTVETIRDLLKLRPSSWDSSVPLFSSQNGKAMDTTHWGHRIKAHALRAGVSLKPYDLRHSACTLHLRNGMNTLILQKLMGHTGPQMTMRYTHLTIDDLRDQQQKSSPVDELIPTARKRARRK